MVIVPAKPFPPLDTIRPSGHSPPTPPLEVYTRIRYTRTVRCPCIYIYTYICESVSEGWTKKKKMHRGIVFSFFFPPRILCGPFPVVFDYNDPAPAKTRHSTAPGSDVFAHALHGSFSSCVHARGNPVTKSTRIMTVINILSSCTITFNVCFSRRYVYTARAIPSRRPGAAAILCTRIYKHEYVHVPDRVYVWRIRIDRLFRSRGTEVVA